MEQFYSEAGISRQAHFQQLKRDVQQAKMAQSYLGLIVEIRKIHPAMGLRKIYNQFQPEGIGRDAFILLGLMAGFRIKRAKNPVRTTFSVPARQYQNLLEDRVFTSVNQLWSSDITYFRIEDQFFYITLIMDVYSRRIIGHHVADNMRAEQNVIALQRALNTRNIEYYNQRLIHHSDRGSQYTSNLYTDLLKNAGIRMSMCNNVLENAHIERVNGTIKNEYLKHWRIRSYSQLVKALDRAVEAYNNRLHDSIKCTPIKLEQLIENRESKVPKNMTIFSEQKLLNK